MKKTIALCTIALLFCLTANAQNEKCSAKTFLYGKSGTFEISISELGSIEDILVKNDCDNAVVYEVLSYEFTTSNGGKTTTIKGTGTKLSGPMKQSLGKMQRGGKIFVDNVKVKFPDKTEKIVPGITVKLK